MATLTHQRGGLRAATCILTVCAAAALLYACAGGAGPAGLHRAPQPSIASELAELEAMAAPEGVDAALWGELKEALAEALLNAGGAGVSPASGDGSRAGRPRHQRSTRATKIAATPPTGSDNKVNDLAITNDAGRPRFAWHYRNLGDYDQNGTVAIADITPLAVHFGETYDLITEQNSLAAVIDGSGNGKVDIADVTAIAVGFGVNCTAYKIQNAATALSSTWSDLEEVPQDGGTGEGRLEYAITVDMGAGEYYRAVPVDADGVEGEPSNVQRFAPVPPEVLSVAPTAVVFGTQVQFTASVTGTGPIALAWDFGEACTPDYVEEANPVVTVTEVKDDYPCSVAATNAYGEDVFEFVLTVTGYPPEVQSVDYTEARVGEEITFTATVTGDEPMSYEWEFDGGVDPPASTDESPTLTATEAGDFSGSVTTTNDAGSHQFDFDFTILPVAEAPHIQWVAPQGGLTGAPVQFTAELTGTPPFTYYWDFGGGASPNLISEEQPTVTLGVPGSYDASLRVEGPGGEDIYDFDLTVYESSPGAVVVDTKGGDYPSLAIVGGSPAIAYRREIDPPDNTDPSAFFVRARDADGASWSDPVQAFPAEGSFPGAHNSLVVANGRPAISTTVGFFIEQGAVRYARSRDANGASWGDPIQVWSSAGPSYPPSSLLIVDGRPALAIPVVYAPGEPSLLYYRAEDADGDSWPEEPVVVTSGFTETGVGSCDMKIVGSRNLTDRPAILLSLQQAETMFILAEDELGLSWTEPVTIETFSNTSALALVEEHPALVWRNGGELPRMLLYARAEDDKGQEWANKVELDGWVEDCSGRLGFAIINGRPAVAYANGTWDSRRLYYTVADDELGTSWSPPLAIPTAGNIRDNVALLEVNGRPAIAFGVRDVGDGVLYFIRASDEYGYVWPE